MAEPDFTSILNAFSSPILIAKPVREGSEIKDFELVFTNKAFLDQVSHSVKNSKRLSEFKNNLNPEIPWFDIAEKAVNKIQIEPIVYYSNANKNWFKLQMQGTDNGMIVVSLENVTAVINQDKKLKETAFTDTLTNLPNRNKFNIDFKDILAQTSFCANHLALLLVDIDNMKNINDSKGNQAGDSVLKQAAQILSQFEKKGITSYRFGDDEFIVVIQKADSLNSVINIVDTIFEAFQMYELSVSGGISVFPEHSEDADELIRFADIAMHAAKKNGKNNFTMFKPDMQRVFIQKLNILNKMTQAVLSSKFTQVYQPQFDVKTEKLRGFEALLRWTDEEMGNIPPSFFIPIAEECGLIIPIGNWVLSTAFETLKQWQTKFNFDGIMSINISPIQLKQSNFLSDITTLIRKYKIEPSSVEIEITEGIMIDNMDEAVSKMKSLKDIGFKISLDDFGTGYSSLNYLQILPLDTLKIDKSFINDITGKNGIQANITNSIITMVSNMGLETIAEGVEKDDQYAMIKKFNCTIIQGFLKGKPMSKEACEEYLSGNKQALDCLEHDYSRKEQFSE